MSKIELTKEQVQRLRGSWSMPGTYHEALEKVANELVAMGLVRPATLAARSSVAGQLEPSEEEIDKACNAYEPHYAASTPSFVESVRRGVTAALTAAARVRLEKAEGEQ